MEPATCPDCGSCWPSPRIGFPCCGGGCTLPFDTTWPGVAGAALPSPWTDVAGLAPLVLDGAGALAIESPGGAASALPLAACCGGTACYRIVTVIPDTTTIWALGLVTPGGDPFTAGAYLLGFGPALTYNDSSTPAPPGWDFGPAPTYSAGDQIELVICDGTVSLYIEGALSRVATPGVDLSTATDLFLLGFTDGDPHSFFHGLAVSCACTTALSERWEYPAGPVPDPPWAVLAGDPLIATGAGTATGPDGGGLSFFALPAGFTAGGWFTAENVSVVAGEVIAVAFHDAGESTNDVSVARQADNEWVVIANGGTEFTGIVADTVDVAFQWNGTDWTVLVDSVEFTGLFPQLLVGDLGVLVGSYAPLEAQASFGPILTGCEPIGPGDTDWLVTEDADPLVTETADNLSWA